MRAKILMAEVADLSEGIRQRDSLIHAKERAIERCKSSKDELKYALDLRENIIGEQKMQIENLGDINRNSKKIWRNRTIYFGAGGLAAGVVAGLLLR